MHIQYSLTYNEVVLFVEVFTVDGPGLGVHQVVVVVGYGGEQERQEPDADSQRGGRCRRCRRHSQHRDQGGHGAGTSSTDTHTHTSLTRPSSPRRPTSGADNVTRPGEMCC